MHSSLPHRYIGPFLIHTDASGKVLESPVPLPDFDNAGKEIRSPQHPFNEAASAARLMNAVRAHGHADVHRKPPVFSPWYVMLADDDMDPFIDNRTSPPGGSGLAPAASEIFNVASIQGAGYPVVVWTVNDISTPGQPGDVGLGEDFSFPFTTIEDVVVLDRNELGVINDNNLPFSIGRHVGSGAPDDTEFIIVRLERLLGTISAVPQGRQGAIWSGRSPSHARPRPSPPEGQAITFLHRTSSFLDISGTLLYKFTPSLAIRGFPPALPRHSPHNRKLSPCEAIT